MIVPAISLLGILIGAVIATIIILLWYLEITTTRTAHGYYLFYTNTKGMRKKIKLWK